MAAAVGSVSPCGACKFLRRKCAPDCIFAPYFCCEQGQARFAAMHKVFGASNVSKLLKHLPVSDRGEAVITMAYEAQARIRDPVYGCVAHILALQQQVTYLQEQLMQLKTQVLSNNQMQARCWENQWLLGNCTSFPGNQTVPNSYPISSRQRSPESVSQSSNAMALHLRRGDEDERYLLVDEHKPCSRKRSLDDMSMNELQELAFSMMRN